MASHRISVRISSTLRTLIRERARAKRQTFSELVRTALGIYLARRSKSRSAYKAAEEAGLIGCVRHRPKNLSTSRRRFEGFGTS